jgi:hypothetical protein
VKLSDEDLLEAVALLYDAIDPAPDDLADGVRARLAVEDLESEYELLTLVERIDLTAGTRATGDTARADDEATVAMEFAGASYRVLVRISTAGGRRRVDGWVVPPADVHVLIGPPGEGLAHLRQGTDVDAGGRFEFAAPMTGEVRLWLVPRVSGSAETPPPFVTPPFLV